MAIGFGIGKLNAPKAQKALYNVSIVENKFLQFPFSLSSVYNTHTHTHTRTHMYILIALSVIPRKCLLSLFIFKWYKITIDRNALQKSIHITLSFNKIYLLTFYIDCRNPILLYFKTWSCAALNFPPL